MQIHFIEMMYERSGKVDWAQWSGDYKLWREDIQSVLKNDLNKEKDIITESGFDLLIDKSWDGMFSVLGDGPTDVPLEAPAPGEMEEPEEAVDNSENKNNTAAYTGGLLAAATALRMRNKTVSAKPLKNSNTRPADDDIPGKIIFEQDGIHYINNDLLYHSGNTGGKLDGDFQKLVESVVVNGTAN